MKKSMRRVALPAGTTLGPEHKGHYAVLGPNGDLLRSRSGLPIKICSTPSDWRSRKNEMARIKRALHG